MLDVEKFIILKPEVGHIFDLEYSNDNDNDNITKGFEPKSQVLYIEKKNVFLEWLLQTMGRYMDWMIIIEK
ncbi:MAG: hypothetical protein ACE5SW_07785 [Nitrososphaeraceae archaeon]